MNYIEELQERLLIKGNPELQEWWEAYLKHEAKFLGLRMLDIQSILHKWYFELRSDSELSFEEQKELALSLFREEYSEEKIAGIVFLREILLPAGAIDWHTDLPRFAELFTEGWISDWNICDWFCVKVLGPLVEQQGEDCARAISEWRKASNMWQQRAAGVAFVNLAPKGNDNFPGFVDMLLEICTETVRHQERFSQTGTGWVLRELSNADVKQVEIFIESNIGHFSGEGLKKAIEKMPDETQERLKQAHKDCG